MNDSEIVLPSGQQVSTFFEDQRQTVRNFEATHGQAARGIDPVRGNLDTRIVLLEKRVQLGDLASWRPTPDAIILLMANRFTGLA